MMTRYVVWALLPVALVGLASGPAAAQQMYVYPAQDQSPEQQNQDQFECHQWSVQQTGVDPTTQSQAGAPQSSGGTGANAVRGAVGGATIGVIGGAIAGDAGKGAAIGAATGALIGGFRRQSQQKKEEQQRRQYEQQQAAAIQAYNNAVATCLRGRGYTVS
jgi:hypothetical protein